MCSPEGEGEEDESDYLKEKKLFSGYTLARSALMSRNMRLPSSFSRYIAFLCSDT
jgi:hypothetical protein